MTAFVTLSFGPGSVDAEMYFCDYSDETRLCICICYQLHDSWHFMTIQVALLESIWKHHKASKLGWTFDNPGVLIRSRWCHSSRLFGRSGIPSELVIVANHIGMDTDHQQHLHVCAATSCSIGRHFHVFPIISPNKHQNFWGNHPSNTPGPLVLPRPILAQGEDVDLGQTAGRPPRGTAQNLRGWGHPGTSRAGAGTKQEMV